MSPVPRASRSYTPAVIALRPFLRPHQPSPVGFMLRVLGVAVAASTMTGCSQISEDFGDLMSGINDPTPYEAAVWAADFNNPGRQRRGVVLLSNADFGGEEAYLELYRTLVEDSTNPLVRAAAVRALGRWGDGPDAQIIAAQLGNDSPQIRLESAIALQRIHERPIEDRIWRRLVDADEEESIRIELAIALGQYDSDASFQALCDALDDRSLSINLAAADSLRIMTGRDFGLDAATWLSWYDGQRRDDDNPFAEGQIFLYPTFQRKIGFFESLAFWSPKTFEDPGVPRGLSPTTRSTYSDDVPPDREYENLGEGP